MPPPPSLGAATSMDGRAAALALEQAVRRRANALAQRRRRPVGLAVLQVGADPASDVYVRIKARRARALGLSSLVRRLAASASAAEVAEAARALADDPTVDALLLQLPLPPHLSAAALLATIDPGKDVDGLHPCNLGRLMAGLPGPAPCTPAGICRLLAHHRVPLVGRRAVVVGRSAIVGRPLAAMLLRRHATVTTCHRHTHELAAHVAAAELVVVAVGQRGAVDAAWLRPGAVVVDVGIHRLADGLVGDLDAETAGQRAGLLTPVPGGVGPMTVAVLLHNAVALAEVAAGVDAAIAFAEEPAP